MKIKFDKLETSSDSIKVSFNGGKSYEDFDVDNIQKRGITLDDSQNYGKIRIVGKSTVLKNLDVVKDISIPNKVFYLTQYSSRYGCGRYETSIGGILVSKLWLKDLFGISEFKGEYLTDAYNYNITPFGYLEDGEPLLYQFNLNNGPVLYNDGTVQKYFFPNQVESENVAKELPTFKILLEDETVFEEKTIYVNYIRDKLYPIINDRPDDFSGYDWDVFKNVWEDYDEETDSYTESFQHYFRIEDQQVNVWDSLYLDNDITLRICNKQEHVYHYNAQYVDDQSKFSISFTKSNPQLPDTPTKPFATFLGWYQDSSFYTPLNLGDIDSDSYIYAKWEYLDVTRTVYFMYKDQRFEIDFTKKSNQTENISNVLSQLKYKYTGFSTLSSNYNYEVPFNSDEDLDITQYVSNISVKSFTNTFRVWTSSSSAVNFTESFNYYEPSIELEPIVDKIYNDYLQKGAFANYVFEDNSTNTFLDIDSLNAIRRKNGDAFIQVRTKNVESVNIIYDNFNDNNKAIELGLPTTLEDTINFGYGYPEYCPLYVSLETINEDNNGKQYFTSYGDRKVHLYELNSKFKSLDTFDTIHFCFKFGDSLYPKISLYVENYGRPKNSVQYNENIVLPKNFNELLSFTGLDIKNFTKDDVEPEEGTYSMSYTIGNDHYLPGETASFPMISVLDNNEYKVNTAYEIKIKFFAIPINYNSTAKLRSKDFFGEDKELETNVVLKLNDSHNTDVITDLNIEYSIDSLDNCTFNKLNNKEVYLYKTFLDKSINVTFLDNSLRNCFGGIGDTSTEENINKITNLPHVYLSKNLELRNQNLVDTLNLINNKSVNVKLYTENPSSESSIIYITPSSYKCKMIEYTQGYFYLISSDVELNNLPINTYVFYDSKISFFIKIDDVYYDSNFNVISNVDSNSIIRSSSFYNLTKVPTTVKQLYNYIGCEFIFSRGTNNTSCVSSSLIDFSPTVDNWGGIQVNNLNKTKEISQLYAKGKNGVYYPIERDGKVSLDKGTNYPSGGITEIGKISTPFTSDPYQTICLVNGKYACSRYNYNYKDGYAYYINSLYIDLFNHTFKPKFTDDAVIMSDGNKYWKGSQYYIPNSTICFDYYNTPLYATFGGDDTVDTPIPEELLNKSGYYGYYIEPTNDSSGQ